METTMEGKFAALEVAVSYALAMASRNQPTDFSAVFARQSELVADKLIERSRNGDLSETEATEISANFTGALKSIGQLTRSFIPDRS